MIDDDRCRPVREHLSDELDGEELLLDVRVAIDAHLSMCAPWPTNEPVARRP